MRSEANDPAAPPRWTFDRLRSAYGFWDAPVFTRPAGLLLFWTLLVLLAVLRCRVGLYGTNYVSHDAFMVLDGAWRMLHHQRPHVDFNSMIGPVAYLPTLVGLRLTHGAARSLAVGQVLAGMLLADWAFGLGSRMAAVPRAFYAFCVFAYVSSPAQLGLSPFFLTPGMTYNRLAYGLLAIVLLECFVESSTPLLLGLSTGLALSLLLFLKVTTVVPGTLLILVLLPLKRQSLRRCFGILFSGAMSVVVAAFYFHWHVRPIVHDIALTLGAKEVHIRTLYSYNQIFLDAGSGVVIAALVGALLTRSGVPERGKILAKCALGVAAVSVLLVLSNWQQAELSLLTLFLIAAVSLLVQMPVASETSPTRHVAEAGVAVFALVPVLSLCVSLAAGIYAHDVTAKTTSGLGAAKAIKDFVPTDGDTSYSDFVNDGVSLLRKNMRPGERVMSLDFTNPFSVGLQIPPAPGGSTNLQYGGSFNYSHFVPPGRLFGQAELVMLPVVFSDPTLQESVPRMYGPYLQGHFHLVDRSSRWQLYRRDE